MKAIKIKILFFCSVTMFLINCGQTGARSSIIDGLENGDTLTLFAEYAECGEWGGHIERVLVIKKDEALWTSFYNGTISCPIETITRKIKVGKSKALSTEARSIIENYITKILHASTIKEEPESNSLFYFKLITKAQTYQYNNWKKDWKEFEIMRTKLFDN